MTLTVLVQLMTLKIHQLYVVMARITTVMGSLTSLLTQDVVQLTTQLRPIVMVHSVTMVVMMTTTVE